MRLIDSDEIRIKPEYMHDICGSVMIRVEDVARIINEMPTINPQPQWILCSEKMPEEHEWIGTKKFGTTISDEVHVTFEAHNGDRFVRQLSFQNGDLSAFEQRVIDAWHGGSKPIAWMKFPEPYKEGNDEIN